jgi:hypothetical protein
VVPAAAQVLDLAPYRTATPALVGEILPPRQVQLQTVTRTVGICRHCGGELTDLRSIMRGAGKICALKGGEPW